MTESPAITLETLVREAAERMEAAGLVFGHGTDNAVDEACWMASAALGLPPDFDEAEFDRTVPEEGRRKFRELLEARIATRKPLAYLLGEAWFAGLRFRVNEHVLVPRSPLAELIRDGFAPWRQPQQVERVADVGTGSGCLAIALAHYWPHMHIDAVDISPEALDLARANAEDHGVSERVHCHRSDLLDDLPDRRYDVILTNPPYVPTDSMGRLPPEFRWEPALGLAAGSDGLDLVRRLLDTAADHLRPGGMLICEVGEAAAALDALLAGRELTWLSFEHGGDGVFLMEREALAG